MSAASDLIAPSRPRRRRSRPEVRAIVEFTASLLTSRLPKRAIKRQLKTRYGCSSWAAEKYLARARDRVLAQTNMQTLASLVEAARHFLGVLQDPAAGGPLFGPQPRRPAHYS